MEANALAGPDVVDVPAGTYALTIPLSNLDPFYFDTDAAEGDLDILDDLTLRGAGSASTIVDASGLGDRLVEVPFYVNGIPLTILPAIQLEIVGLTLKGGRAALDGGCVRHWNDGPLTLRDAVLAECSVAYASGGGLLHIGHNSRIQRIDSVVRDNQARYAGGINGGNGTIELVRSVVTRNTAVEGPGGGIYIPPGGLQVTDSVVSDNESGYYGGGIYASQSDVTPVRTTVSGNRARNTTSYSGFGLGSGGGLYLERVRLAILNSTISGNLAEDDGAGIFGERGVDFDVSFSTIADNRNESNGGVAGMQMFAPVAFVPIYQRVRATVFARNVSDGGSVNCGFTKQLAEYVGGVWTITELPLPPASGGFSVDDDGSCGLTMPTDLSGMPAGLAPLAANGGLGATHALLVGSPAIDRVASRECFFGVDDDRDYRVDEDPIDGLDDDHDGRVDEDPPGAVATDERGTPRPYGAGCDAGAFEVSPIPALTQIQTQVQALIDSGVLNGGQGHALLVKLGAAAAALAAGDTAAAIDRLEAFVNQVEAFERARILTAAEAEPLLDAARALIAQLRG